MPNNLPLNWCECKLEDLGSFFGGYAFKSSNYSSNGARVVRITNVQKGYFDDESPKFYNIQESLNDFLLQNDDILISLTGNVGRVCKIEQKYLPAYLNQRVEAFRIGDKICSKFVYYFMQQQDFEKKCIENSKGVAQKNMSPEYIKKYLILLPPLAEQERIVAKIEALFQDIDEGVERLKSAQAQIKQYRQSVLKSAFCFQNNYFCYLKDCIEKPRYGTSKKCSIDLKNSTPVYRIPNINFLKGIIDKSELKYAVFDDTEKKSLSLQKGDILLIRSNGSLNLVGRAALIHDNDINGLFAGYLIRIRVADYTILNPEFLLYYLNSPKARTYIEEKAKSTSGVNNINSEEISELEIPLPTLPEQQRIVEEIEKRFAVADVLEKAVNEGLEKADKLKQSILKKAFEGKLVAQNPNDEPASVLLERIKKEQIPTKGKKK